MMKKLWPYMQAIPEMDCRGRGVQRRGGDL